MAAPVLAPASFRAMLAETLEAENYRENYSSIEAFAEVYAGLRDTLRVYFLSPEVTMSMVWTPFRNNELALDLLMRYSMSFHTRLAEVQLQELFLASIEAGLGAAGQGKGAYMDEDFTGKLVKVQNVKDLPGWLTFLIYCFMEPVLVLTILRRHNKAASTPEKTTTAL